MLGRVSGTMCTTEQEPFGNGEAQVFCAEENYTIIRWVQEETRREWDDGRGLVSEEKGAWYSDMQVSIAHVRIEVEK